MIARNLAVERSIGEVAVVRGVIEVVADQTVVTHIDLGEGRRTTAGGSCCQERGRWDSQAVGTDCIAAEVEADSIADVVAAGVAAEALAMPVLDILDHAALDTAVAHPVVHMYTVHDLDLEFGLEAVLQDAVGTLDLDPVPVLHKTVDSPVLAGLDIAAAHSVAHPVGRMYTVHALALALDHNPDPDPDPDDPDFDRTLHNPADVRPAAHTHPAAHTPADHTPAAHVHPTPAH